MSTLILSLLLVLLILAGMFMRRQVVERFVNVETPSQVQISPTLVNMLATPKPSQAVQADPLARAIDMVKMDQVQRWKEVPNSTNMRAEEDDCKAVGSAYQTSLAGCMEQCDNNEQCNLVNYDDDAGPSCLMRRCDDPADPGLIPGFDGSVVWSKPNYKTGPGPKPGPKSGPKPGPKSGPETGPSSCPDMSQYIRLDEIPCWNCSLP